MLEKFRFNLMLYVISFLCFMGGTVYLAALPDLGLLFHVSSSYVKFSLTIFFIGLLFGTLHAGPFSEVYGRFRVLVLFLIIFSAASLLCGLADSIWWFLIGRFFQGFGLASGPIISIALVADRYKGAEYTKYLAYVLMMLGLGGGAGPILGSFILHYLTWECIFYILTAVGILSLGLVFSTKNSIPFHKRQLTEVLSEYNFFLKHKTFVYYCLSHRVLHWLCW